MWASGTQPNEIHAPDPVVSTGVVRFGTSSFAVFEPPIDQLGRRRRAIVRIFCPFSDTSGRSPFTKAIKNRPFCKSRLLCAGCSPNGDVIENLPGLPGCVAKQRTIKTESILYA